MLSFLYSIVCWLLLLPAIIDGFTLPSLQRSHHQSLTTLYGTNRRARRLQQKQKKSEITKTLEEVQEVNSSDDKPSSSSSSSSGTSTGVIPSTLPGTTATSDDDRPEISTVVIDETTGFEKIAQGKAVMDVVTRQAVVLSNQGPEYRLAQMFPGIDPSTRSQLRFDDFYNMNVMDMISQLEDACLITLDGERVIPPHPSVSQKGIDFVLANRDYLGLRMKKTLGRLKMRAQSTGDLDAARRYRRLLKHFMTLEDHISAPFRQMVLDAEAQVGPNFGNLDLKSYVGTDLYQRCATYIVLKGMVAHWEKKYRDAEFLESEPASKDNFMSILSTGDPKRYLPNPPIIFRLADVTRVCAMAQKLTKEFVDDESFFGDLPPELRFVESALNVQGGTALRKFMAEFCEEEEITPAALREGLRRLDQQLENMQIDPYGDFKNTVARLSEAMAVGTDEENDPYGDFLYNPTEASPGWFQTYTMSSHKNSMVRFLDNAKVIEKEGVGPVDDVMGQMGKEITTMFGLKSPPKQQRSSSSDSPNDKFEAIGDDGDEYYRPPEKRSMGRPHDMGWLELLDDQIPKSETDDDTFESDNWREIRK